MSDEWQRRFTYRNARERIAHKLTGSICGQCKCSNSLGWSKPEMQARCECYETAGEVVAMANAESASALTRLQDRIRELENGIADEREACAKCADKLYLDYGPTVSGVNYGDGWLHACDLIAQAIRARSLSPTVSDDTSARRAKAKG